MPFIGIIADEKKEKIIRRELVHELKLKESLVLDINEKNIENIKNVKFETIIIDRKFKNIEKLKKILAEAIYVVINTDIIKNLNILENLELTVITYGFNSKATITASSVTEESSLICLQRTIENIHSQKIEMQEIKIEDINDINLSMIIVAIMLIYKNNQHKNIK